MQSPAFKKTITATCQALLRAQRPPVYSRRQFLRAAMTVGGIALGGGGQAGAEQRAAPVGRLQPAIEPLVRLLEETPRDRVLEAVGQRVQGGLVPDTLLAALFLAGVRNIQPRPVGYKFHAVMVVHAVHLTSRLSPAADKWLPLFWAVDDFKHAQYQDIDEGDWTMGPVQESQVPPPHQANTAFTQAMDGWDEAAADVAAAGLARAAEPSTVFDLFCRYGARDFRAIGHKAIYLANGWRTLQHMGWQHAEPVLRSLAYALLEHEGSNPAQRDDAADRPWRRNEQRLGAIRADWQQGETQAAATTELLQTLRRASSEDASDAVVKILNRGIAPQSVWDALFSAAGELLLQRPGILSLHAVTCTNAIHFAFQNTTHDRTRRLLLLQNAAFLTRFRGDPEHLPPLRLDALAPGDRRTTGPQALHDILADISQDRHRAARNVLAYLQQQPQPSPFLDAVRHLLVYKGTNAHDYKFAAAVLEDQAHLSPAWRQRYLAASVAHLHGSGDANNPLVARIRAAL